MPPLSLSPGATGQPQHCRPALPRSKHALSSRARASCAGRLGQPPFHSGGARTSGLPTAQHKLLRNRGNRRPRHRKRDNQVAPTPRMLKDCWHHVYCISGAALGTVSPWAGVNRARTVRAAEAATAIEESAERQRARVALATSASKPNASLLGSIDHKAESIQVRRRKCPGMLYRSSVVSSSQKVEGPRGPR